MSYRITPLVLFFTFATVMAGAATASDWPDRLDLPFYRGISLQHVAGGDEDLGYGSIACGLSLDRAASLGADAVLLAPSGLQGRVDAPFIESRFETRWAANDARLAETAQQAHARGMRVVLAPRLDVENAWSGEIAMNGAVGWDKWFRSYRDWIAHYARLAEELDVDLFCVGTELGLASQRESQWREVIGEVRAHYTGPLTYAANWSGELENIQFWDALDVIGVQAFGPLAASIDASAEVLAQGAAAQATELATLSEQWHRPVVVTGVGFRSVPWAHVRPWQHHVRDDDDSPSAQSNAYRAWMGAMGDNASWLRGAFWSGWTSAEPTPSVAGSFDPRGRPAEAHLSKWFGDAPPRLTARRVQGFGGVVVSDDTLATRIGVEVLRRGGNAVDAAVACAFALAVTRPHAGNLGGGGFLMAYDDARAKGWALDFTAQAPAAAHAAMFTQADVNGRTDPSRVGPLAAGIPGTVAGLHAAWERGGRLNWGELVEPARQLAANGFAAGPALVSTVHEYRNDLARFPSSRAIFLEPESPTIKKVFRQPELARVLKLIEERGPRGFYQGDIAEELVEGVRDFGGNWRLEDLRGYQPRWVEPVELTLSNGSARSSERRGGSTATRRMLTMPPPSAGGVVTSQVIELMRCQQADRFEPHSFERARAWTESLRLAFADRASHLADPSSMSIHWRRLIEPRYVRRRCNLIPPGRAGSSDHVGPGRLATRRGESPETTHLSVIDAAGNAVSLTTTLNGAFGCGFVAPSTGVVLNNLMDDFVTRPNDTLESANTVQPGARMLSSMSPAIVLDGQRVWFALGGRGGKHILSAVAQTAVHRVWDDMPLDRAIAAPRVHHQWWPDLVELEEMRTWPGLDDEFEKQGYKVRKILQAGVIHGVELEPDGSLVGVTDPRGGGLALCVDRRR